MAGEGKARKAKASPKEAPISNGLLTLYLTMYNAAQWMSWAYLAYLLLVKYIDEVQNGTYECEKYMREVYSVVGSFAGSLTLLGFLETIHALARFVKTSPMPTLFQTLGRFAVLNITVASVSEAQAWVSTGSFLLCFVVIENIRYPYYTVAQVLSLCNKKPPYILTWLRYTAWIPIYPTGIVTEWLTYYFSLPYLNNLELKLDIMPSISLPFYYVVVGLLVFYPIGGFVNLSHMGKQRKKALSPKQKFE
uniref:very-long-chain (3R)-3-hydroxyacyl-CoA dehydratase n=1 Tax=Palpitomonas bilix TaxID=652834 RepID=A0A7S3G5H1_9EUKA